MTNNSVIEETSIENETSSIIEPKTLHIAVENDSNANDNQLQTAETNKTVIEETSIENETSSITEPETVNNAAEKGSNANDSQLQASDTNIAVIEETSNGNETSPSSEPKTSNIAEFDEELSVSNGASPGIVCGSEDWTVNDWTQVERFMNTRHIINPETGLLESDVPDDEDEGCTVNDCAPAVTVFEH